MAYIDQLLGSDEKVLMTAHRHIFVLLGHFLKELFVLAALLTGLILIRGGTDPGFFWIEIAIGAIAVLVIVSMFVDWVRWKNEAFYITNRRVLQTSGVFNKRVLDSSIIKINDVITEQSFLGRIFDYGTIKILTATEEVINSVDRISSPLEFKKAMLGAKAQLEPIGTTAPSTSSVQLLEDLNHLRDRKLITEEEYNEKRKEILKRI